MAKFIMASPLQAIGFVLLFAILAVFMPLMGLLSNAAIGLVTLRMGWQRGLLIAAASSVVFGILGLFLQASVLTGFAISLLGWIPVVGLASLLTRTVSWAKTLTVLLVLGIAGTVLFHLMVDDPVKFWQAQPEWAQFVELAKQMQVLPADMPQTDQDQLMSGAARILAGSLAATIEVMLVLSLLIARHWQAMLYNPGGLGEEWRKLQLGKPAALLMIAAITLALLSQHTGAINVVLAGLAIFLFQGIALVHGVVALLQQHRGWIIGMYVLLFLMPAQLGILLAAFGIIDSLAGFRSQIEARKG
jgi:hypothetical protein